MKELIEYLGNSTTGERFNKLTALLKHNDIHFITQESNETGYFAVKNIIIPARNQDDKIVLCAHYDVVMGSPAILDNTTAIVIILTALPQLLQHDNVEILFTDKEEAGGRGASEYCYNGPKPYLVINMDIIGHGDVLYYCKYNVHPEILEKLNESCIEQNYPFCDFNIFRMSNVSCISIISAPGGMPFQQALQEDYKCFHNGQHDGDLTKIDFNTLERAQKTILDLVNFINYV
jgi:Zn-dependent M28 family amino/carboxypeptidase